MPKNKEKVSKDMMERQGKRVAGAMCLIIVTFLILRVIQAQQIVPPSRAHVMGIVSTAAEDQRRENQVNTLVQAAEAAGFEVLSIAVERTQDAQIEAIRAMIVYQVDVVLFTPIVESGWDNVLREAQVAKVPLVAVDKSIRATTQQDTVSYVGFDYAALATQITQVLLPQSPAYGDVLELYGTLNSSDAREIARGYRDVLDTSTYHRIAYSLCGDGLRARGYEILEGLAGRMDEIGMILAHNDAMALGAVEYLQEHQLKAGQKICIGTIGGGEDVRAQLAQGNIQAIGALDDRALANEAVHVAQEVIAHPQESIVRYIPAQVLQGGAHDVKT